MSSQWTCSYRTQKQYVTGHMSGHVEQEKSPPSLRRDHRLPSSERLVISWVGLSASAGHLSSFLIRSRDVVSYLVACQTCHLPVENTVEFLASFCMAENHADPEKAEVKVMSTGYESHMSMILSMAANGQARSNISFIPNEDSLDLNLDHDTKWEMAFGVRWMLCRWDEDKVSAAAWWACFDPPSLCLSVWPIQLMGE